jgi:hypothetical protein
MSEPVLVTKMPDGWITSPVLDSNVFAEGQCPAGLCALTGVLLRDGTNIYALTWPTGQRVARTCHATGWSIEERFDGEQPSSDDDPRARLWSIAIEGMVRAAQETRDELEGRIR